MKLFIFERKSFLYLVVKNLFLKKKNLFLKKKELIFVFRLKNLSENMYLLFLTRKLKPGENLALKDPDSFERASFAI